MKIVFDKLAQLELEDALEYYELEVPGLGARFKVEVKCGIRRIRKYPDAWAKEKNDVRRCFLHKFPYKILYSIEEDYIYIIAIAHCHRHPDYWIDRILEKS
ncbi:MAG: type II toxin-antitoxin system RelE/ParE family toxin [Candidatus Marinimicrobia bacterium]|nr:type II toxin-antitoxin system RelE/ParE family toxin [Candidatus Neomarinimicrobiota bacterium]